MKIKPYVFTGFWTIANCLVTWSATWKTTDGQIKDIPL